MPEVVYLLAFWWVRQALAAFAAGELLTPAVARTLLVQHKQAMHRRNAAPST